MASSIEVRILRAANGDTWSDEIVVLVDNADFLATLGRGRWQTWMGLDPVRSQGSSGDFDFPPGKVFGSPGDDQPTDRFIARCDCGELGCGALVARVNRSGDDVIWDRFRSGSGARSEWKAIAAEPLVFPSAQYDQALRTPTAGGVWQPTTRRAALRAKDLVDEANLTAMRLRAAGFSSRGDREVVARMILGRKGDPDYSFLTFGTSVTSGESPEDVAQRVAQSVTTGDVLTDVDVDRKVFARPGVTETD